MPQTPKKRPKIRKRLARSSARQGQDLFVSPFAERAVLLTKRAGVASQVLDFVRDNQSQWFHVNVEQPSREDKVLSDFPLHILGRTINITGREQFLGLVFLTVAVLTWGVLQLRQRRSVVLQRSAVSDQIVYELSRIADALDRLGNRSLDQAIHPTIPAASSFKEGEPRSMPFSMFGRER